MQEINQRLMQTPRLSEINVVWISAGLSCDGDSVSITAATQPSLEELIGGALPGVPKMRLYNPLLVYEVGEEFLAILRRAIAGELDPFILVVEGSIPNEKIKDEGFFAAMGTDPETGQPILTCTWID